MSAELHVNGERVYTSPEALRLVPGLTYRQLDYAVRCGDVPTAATTPYGWGGRLFDANGIAGLRLVKIAERETCRPVWFDGAVSFLRETDLESMRGWAIVANSRQVSLLPVERLAAIHGGREPVTVIPCDQLIDGLFATTA